MRAPAALQPQRTQMGEKELASLIARVGDLPAMPAVAMKVMEMVGDQATSARALQGIIQRDQALTAKVLKIANSAMFGVSRDITTLSHAIVMLGFDTIRSVVLAASTKSIFFKCKGIAGFSGNLLWEHSLVAAAIARRLASKLDGVGVEESFISGLLHDIGKSVLNINFFDKYSEVVRETYNTDGDWVRIERKLLGFDHSQVGAVVVRKWNLARTLEEAVRYHHNPKVAGEFPVLTATVALADEIANTLGKDSDRRPAWDAYSSAAVRMLGIGRADLDGLMEEMSNLMKDDEALFSI